MCNTWQYSAGLNCQIFLPRINNLIAFLFLNNRKVQTKEVRSRVRTENARVISQCCLMVLPQFPPPPKESARALVRKFTALTTRR